MLETREHLTRNEWPCSEISDAHVFPTILVKLEHTLPGVIRTIMRVLLAYYFFLLLSIVCQVKGFFLDGEY